MKYKLIDEQMKRLGVTLHRIVTGNARVTDDAEHPGTAGVHG